MTAVSPIDLHVHTTCSDGTLTPEETVAEAARLGLAAIAIADHDITDGIAPAAAAARAARLGLIPAVEINTDYRGTEVHVLGYFIATEDGGLQESLRRLREGRRERNRRILERLRALGRPVEEERVLELAGEGSVGRPHIAQALVEAGYVQSVHDAFARYLSRGRSAYVERYRVTPAEAIEMVQRAGGLAALGHPAKVGRDGLIPELVKAGLAALEAYHCDHTPADTARYLDLARRFNLLVTGGTDSHGPHSDKPVALGSVPVPGAVGERLLAARGLDLAAAQRLGYWSARPWRAGYARFSE
jgi:hypothetical protein